MWWSRREIPAENPVPAAARPVLDLDGRRLRSALERLVTSADELGGVEMLVRSLVAKSQLYADTFTGHAGEPTRESFLDACAFASTTRRRVGAALERHGFEAIRDAVSALTPVDDDPAFVDERLGAFVARFPTDRTYRWVRDLAAEVIHFRAPDRHPLMTRWMWDRGANTGVLREIWYGENVDGTTLEIDDGYATHATLRDELAGFLRDNGVYAEVALTVDLLCAWIYAEYIASQGASFLKTHFAGEDDTMPYALRMLGLDAVDPDSGATRLVLPGEARRHRLDRDQGRDQGQGSDTAPCGPR